jgi:hypothetical protein
MPKSQSVGALKHTQMKKIFIGALVGTIIFFGWQTAMWMGGFHNDFTSYTPNQDQIINHLNENLDQDGLYFIPAVDPSLPDYNEAQEKLMTEAVGKPWAIVIYHKAMQGMSAKGMLTGVFYTFVSCWITCMVLFFGGFGSFSTRFLTSMGFATFALVQGALSDMNWWDFPWNFVKTQVIDLGLGWALCSLWLAWYVKKEETA